MWQGGCQGRWRELRADFREAGRCCHGNHRPVTSLKKKKDNKFEDFICCFCTLPGGEGWVDRRGGGVRRRLPLRRGCGSTPEEGS